MSIFRRSVQYTFSTYINYLNSQQLKTTNFCTYYALKRWTFIKFHRSLSTGQNNVDKNNVNSSACESFESMLNFRRNQAEKSILVQVHSEQSCAELFEYCNNYGSVKGLHHYCFQGSQHFVLVEFSDKQDVDNILLNSGHMNSSQVVPVHSPFLWFRAKGKSSATKSPQQGNKQKNIPLLQENGNTSPTVAEIKEYMLSVETLSDQIVLLYNATSLQDLGTRLRFMTALQLELSIHSLFPLARALPFGSSVNGFGKAGSDLDVVLELEIDKPVDSSCRLIFQAKSSLNSERVQIQRHMETIADICQLFLPGCSQVKRILNARVPIIKYRQDLTGVDCDISLLNVSGVYMGELMYIFGELDSRVKPLVFAVRFWAKEVGVTNPTPGRWITNFNLLLLVIFYLQQEKILPTLNILKSLAGPKDKRVTAEGVNCTFARDIEKVKEHITHNKKNKKSLGALLLSFFEYYSNFDFESRAISINDGVVFPKPEHSALYIVNPLENSLNVTKNVSPEETQRFKMECLNAAYTLQAASEQHNSAQTADRKQPWGLLSIFDSAQLSSKGRNFFLSSSASRNANRLMNVKELFIDEDSWEDGSPLKRNRSDIKTVVPDSIVETSKGNSVSKTVQFSKSKRRR